MQAARLAEAQDTPILPCMEKPIKEENNVPLPPDEEKPEAVKEPPTPKPEPTRFGDWEINGRCIDF